MLNKYLFPHNAQCFLVPLFQQLCWHNLPNPTCGPNLITGSYYAGAYLCSQVVPDLIMYKQYSLHASA